MLYERTDIATDPVVRHTMIAISDTRFARVKKIILAYHKLTVNYRPDRDVDDIIADCVSDLLILGKATGFALATLQHKIDQRLEAAVAEEGEANWLKVEKQRG